MHTIAIDAMGGDHAPDITVAGSIEALRTFEDIAIILVGQSEKIAPLVGAEYKDRITLLDARESIENTESPVMAIRRKTDSSLVKAYGLLRDGKAQALVSAGSTGAVMAGGMFRLGRIAGVERPALAALLPTMESPILLVDTGANVDCQPEWLLQFATMGHVYMQKVMGVSKPRIGLLNNGEEAEKGNQQTIRTYKLLEQHPGIHFVGNLEGRDVPMGEADVVVADGFAGNILLKSMEGISSVIFKLLKQELMSGMRTKLGAALCKPAFETLKHKMDADEVGGVPLLGVAGAVIKAHGSSNGHAFFCAIRQAVRMLEGNVVENIQKNMNLLSKEETKNV